MQNSAEEEVSSNRIYEAAAFLTSLGFVLFDAGWVVTVPSLVLPGTVLGTALQAYCLVVSILRREGFMAAMQLSMCLWIIGNVAWAWSELIWPEPQGCLANIPWVANLNDKYRVPSKVFGVVTLCGAVLVLVAAYLTVWIQHYKRVRAINRERALLLHDGGEAPHAATDNISHLSGLTSLHITTNHNSAVQCVKDGPRRLLYVLPFVVADTLWEVANFLQDGTVSAGSLTLMAFLVFVLGMSSVIGGCTVVWYDMHMQMYSNAWLLGADVLWVFANIAWAVQDILEDFLSDKLDNVLRVIWASLFAACGVGMIISLFVENKLGPSRSSRAGVFSVTSFTNHDDCNSSPQTAPAGLNLSA